MKTCKGCKHYKKDERIGIIVCEFGLHESYCEKDKEDFAIEELEKIKDEIEDLDLGFVDEDYRAGVARGIMEFNKILNNHIAELKGENNV